MDMYNNEVVAYKLFNHQQVPLIIDTLKQALEDRNHPEDLIIYIAIKGRSRAVYILPMPFKTRERTQPG
jgi:hypothetical protein